MPTCELTVSIYLRVPIAPVESDGVRLTSLIPRLPRTRMGFGVLTAAREGAGFALAAARDLARARAAASAGRGPYRMARAAGPVMGPGVPPPATPSLTGVLPGAADEVGEDCAPADATSNAAVKIAEVIAPRRPFIRGYPQLMRMSKASNATPMNQPSAGCGVLGWVRRGRWFVDGSFEVSGDGLLRSCIKPRRHVSYPSNPIDRNRRELFPDPFDSKE
jgi:hypothetical protein